MDGFKNTTKTQYFKGDEAHEAKGAAKVAKVMGEFKSGKLHSGSKHGPEVTSRKQATAIAMSEARKAGAKMPMKKAGGGAVSDQDMKMLQSAEADDALMARMTPRELAMGRAGIAAARARLSGKKAPSKAVPVASKRPMVGNPAGVRGVYGQGALSDSEMQTIKKALGYKKGGPVKKAVGGPATAATGAATTTAANAPAYRPTPEMATAANARINARMAARNTPEALAKQRALTEKRAKVAAGAAKSAALIQKAKDVSAKSAANQKAFADRTAAAVQQARANPNPSPLMQRIQANKQRIQANKQQIAANAAARAANQKAFADRNAARTPVKKAAGGLAAMPKGKC